MLLLYAVLRHADAEVLLTPRFSPSRQHMLIVLLSAPAPLCFMPYVFAAPARGMFCLRCLRHTFDAADIIVDYGFKYLSPRRHEYDKREDAR